jgi:DNA modification methylase
MADTARNKYVRNFKNGELSYKKTGKMKTVYYPIGKLIEAEYNPRQLTKEQYHNLKDSMSRFGIVDPLIVNTHKDRKNILVGGHQRLRVARDLGLKDIPCVEVDLNPDKEKELNIRLNKNVGEWDFDALANYFDVGELTEWGFTDDELQFYEDEPTEGLIDDDEIPEVEEAVTKTGDLWLLGEHRLLCGDATKKEDVERLMDGQKADMVFTDPPYNVDYEGGTNEKMTIKNDAMSEDEYVKFLSEVFGNYKKFVKGGGSFYICHASSWQMVTEQVLNDYDIEVRNQIVWGKNTFAWGFGRYKFQHEPIFYCHIKGKSDNWYGDKSQSTLWLENKPVANKLHPTMKPVEIVLRATENSSKEGDLILDLFLGSGSTLIACEKTNRKCYGMEIDEHYCDVIVKRWEDYTGNKAERFEAASA